MWHRGHRTKCGLRRGGGKAAEGGWMGGGSRVGRAVSVLIVSSVEREGTECIWV
jgi:hypothetical protein